jgi:hypothetical protein
VLGLWSRGLSVHFGPNRVNYLNIVRGVAALKIFQAAVSHGFLVQFIFVELQMSEAKAIERIVAGYVKLGNRKALEGLRIHRQRLATELRSIAGVLDLIASIRQLEEDIAAIDAGLAELKTIVVTGVKVGVA